jgi:hypothetical protein
MIMIAAYRALTCTLYYLGDFGTSRQYAIRGVQIWRSGSVQSYPEEHFTPVVSCLLWGAMSEWELGQIASCHAMMDEGISIATELNDKSSLALALVSAANLAANERNPAEVDRLASEIIELSTRHNFLHWLAVGAIYRGWARSASGDTAEGMAWIEQGIRDYRATGAVVALPYYLGLKAEALHLADHTSEALDAISEAEALAERFEQRVYCVEPHRLRGAFLAARNIRCFSRFFVLQFRHVGSAKERSEQFSPGEVLSRVFCLWPQAESEPPQERHPHSVGCR